MFPSSAYLPSLAGLDSPGKYSHVHHCPVSQCLCLHNPICLYCLACLPPELNTKLICYCQNLSCENFHCVWYQFLRKLKCLPVLAFNTVLYSLNSQKCSKKAYILHFNVQFRYGMNLRCKKPLHRE